MGRKSRSHKPKPNKLKSQAFAPRKRLVAESAAPTSPLQAELDNPQTEYPKGAQTTKRAEILQQERPGFVPHCAKGESEAHKVRMDDRRKQTIREQLLVRAVSIKNFLKHLHGVWRLIALVVAVGALNFSWTMIDHGEFLAAYVWLGAAVLFSFVAIYGWEGIQPYPRVTKGLKFVLFAAVLIVASLFGLLFWRLKGDKPWTSLSARTKQMELSDESGYLVAANDPYVLDECATHVADNAFRIYLGDSTIWTSSERLSQGLYPVVSCTRRDGSHPPVLSVRKSTEGEIYLTADVILRDGRFAVKIDRNKFLRNPHTTGYQRRDDQRTLAIYD